MNDKCPKLRLGYAVKSTFQLGACARTDGQIGRAIWSPAEKHASNDSGGWTLSISKYHAVRSKIGGIVTSKDYGAMVGHLIRVFEHIFRLALGGRSLPTCLAWS
jgi:hypothetical protein